MRYSKFTTFITGFNTAEVLASITSDMTPEQQIRLSIDNDAFMKAHYIQTIRAGKLKPDTVRKIASKLGIVRALKAEAVSFDSSGKGRHVRFDIVV